MELIRNQTLIPQNLTIENYISLFAKSAYWQWVINSTIVAIYTVVLSLPLIVAGAYSVYRTQYRGRNVLSLFLLSVYIFPTALLVVPIFKIFDGSSFQTAKAVVSISAGQPANPVNGQLHYDTSASQLIMYSSASSAWINV